MKRANSGTSKPQATPPPADAEPPGRKAARKPARTKPEPAAKPPKGNGRDPNGQHVTGEPPGSPRRRSKGGQATRQPPDVRTPPGGAAGPADAVPAINQQMLRERNWLLHDGDKRPYYANGTLRRGKLDRPEDLAKLVSYEEAVAALATRTGAGWGLGFAINRGYQFIDLDGCRDPETGKVADWAQAVLDAAKALGAYTEISISGTGVHIVGRHPSGEQDTIRTCPKKPAERYTHGRYAALGTPIGGGTDPLPDLEPLIGLLPAVTGNESRAGKAPGKTRPTPAGPPRAPKMWTVDRHKVPALLEHLKPDMEYPEWIKVGMALHAASGGTEDGLKLWDDWSADGEKYVPGEPASMWAGFKVDGGVGFGTLVHMVHMVHTAHGENVEPTEKTAMVDPIELDWDDWDDDPDPIRFLIPGWLPDGVVTLFAAHGGAGKSYLSLLIALCLATGRNPFCPDEQATPEPIERVKVYLYSAEDSMKVMQFRLARYMRMLGIKPEALRGWLKIVDATESNNVLFTAARDLDGRITARMEWLRREVAAFGADLLIFDNASDALDGNENDRSVVRQFITALKSAAPATLLLAHVDAVSSMVDADKAKGYSGSTGWHNGARSRWFMSRDAETDRIVLKVPKANYAKSGTEAEIAWDDIRGLFRVLEVRDGRVNTEDHREVLLGLLAEVLASGRNVSPSSRSSNNLFKSLQPLVGFPRGLISKGVNGELARWLQAGLVRIEQYQKSGRNGTAERLVLTDLGRAVASDRPTAAPG